MMDEDGALGPKGCGSMECEAAWRLWGVAEKEKKQPRKKLRKNKLNLIFRLENLFLSKK